MIWRSTKAVTAALGLAGAILYAAYWLMKVRQECISAPIISCVVDYAFGRKPSGVGDTVARAPDEDPSARKPKERESRDLSRTHDEKRHLKEEEDSATQTKQTGNQVESTARQQALAEKGHRDLIELFGASTYPQGVVLLGVAPPKPDGLSQQAAKQFFETLSEYLRAQGVTVDGFRPRVYTAGHFDVLLNGNTALLAEVGLAQKMRAALLTSVDVNCRPSGQVEGITTCTLSVQLRSIRPDGQTSARLWSQVGAGSDAAQAVKRAAELLVEHHPNWLEGV